jgi:tetratricopeptide (TPR) repeat protein
MESGESGRAEKIARLTDCFGAGDWVAAQSVARQLVEADPKDGEARHLLAQIVFKAGKGQEAIDWMRAALELDPLNAAYNNDHGVMLASLGRWSEAAAAYEVAAVLDRDGFDARFNLALALLRTGQRERARVELDRAKVLQPDLPDVLALDGELLRAEGDPVRAAEAFGKAIGLGLATPDAHVNLGLALMDLERGEEALEAMRTAERIGGGDAETFFRLGDFYHRKSDREGRNGKDYASDREQAERHYRRALALRPDFAEAYNNLGLLLKGDGNMPGAVECYARALIIHPAHVPTHINLGTLRAEEGWMEGAIDSYKFALKIDPYSTDAWNSLGMSYMRLHRLDEAEKAYRRSLEIRPELADTRAQMALLLLLSGRYAEAWPLYENRWQASNWKSVKKPEFSQAEWNGDDLGGRTLLVVAEQGFGDNLQFSRYLPLLRRRYPRARILYWCRQALFRLIGFSATALAWDVEVLPEVLPASTEFDVFISLMSLPGRMGTTLENVPSDVPYLAAPPQLIGKWAARFAGLKGKKLGLVWSGSETYWQKFRAVRLERMEPLFQVGGIHWISLQKGPGAGQIAGEGLSDRIVDVMGEAGDFADTAAIIAHLDLVIGVDTAVLHLAGAMGKPVWLLNRFDTDWRWLLEREDSPWYPSLRIFRQGSLGDWDSAILRMARALSAWVSESGGNPVSTLAVPEEPAGTCLSKRAVDMAMEGTGANDAYPL